MSVNKVILVGEVQGNVQSQNLKNGTKFAKLELKTLDNWIDKVTGKKVTSEELHNVVFYGVVAGIARKHLAGGSQVYIEGKIKSRTYLNQDNVEVKQYDIKCDKMHLLGDSAHKTNINYSAKTVQGNYSANYTQGG